MHVCTYVFPGHELHAGFMRARSFCRSLPGPRLDPENSHGAGPDGVVVVVVVAAAACCLLALAEYATEWRGGGFLFLRR